MNFGQEFQENLNNFSAFGSAEKENIQAPLPPQEEVEEKKKVRRRTQACTELSQRYEYRRAFSEVKLLEAMRYQHLQKGVTYNFITAGDVDSLSYLKVVLNQHDLDYCLLSTWCMAAEDVFQFLEWYKSGRIKKIDMYLGEIFPNSYRVEWGHGKRILRKKPRSR